MKTSIAQGIQNNETNISIIAPGYILPNNNCLSVNLSYFLLVTNDLSQKILLGTYEENLLGLHCC